MQTSTTLDIRPMAGNIGAEISGLDVATVGDDVIAEIRQLWLDHLVVVIRGQIGLTPEGLAQFAQRFGPPYRHPFYEADMGVHPLNIPAGGYWHSDVTFAEHPPTGTMLHAVAVPPVGGDTLWANMYLAYETLSPALRSFLDGLRAIHDFDHFFRYPMGDSLETDRFVLDMKLEHPLPSHPVVRTHPETGRKALFVNESFTQRIDGLTRTESDTILGLLYRHSVRPELTCRHRWLAGDICFWDNRSAMHYPVDDWGGSIEEAANSPRRMNRAVIDAQPVV